MAMNTFLFENEEEKKYALACLAFSKSLNLIDDDSLEGVKKRCDAENEKRKAQLENGETVYGLTHFSYPAFLNFELTRLKLDFVGESEKVKKAYNFTEITRKQMKAYYKENKDLFTRYNNDRFFFFEVKTVIYKKIHRLPHAPFPPSGTLCRSTSVRYYSSSQVSLFDVVCIICTFFWFVNSFLKICFISLTY